MNSLTNAPEHWSTRPIT